MINVWLINGYTTSPRHARCAEIWNDFQRAHQDEILLHWVDNTGKRGPKKDHDECLEQIWDAVLGMRQELVIITEPDFLPRPGLATWPKDMTVTQPVQASMYVTRDPKTATLTYHDCPGAWFIRIFVPALLRSSVLHFSKGGRYNDPCNLMDKVLRASTDGFQGVQLLPQVDRLPFSYAVDTPNVGRHLFWSRHYGDDPNMVVAGLKLADIFAGVDRELAEWST